MTVQKCLLTAAMLLAPAAAMAGVPGPACGTPEVLEIVARILNEHGLPALFVAAPVGQVPTSRPDTVLCAVRLQREVFDTNRFGSIPQYRERTYEYTVRRGYNGVFVTGEGG
jgi:hypothetical protein